jgi:GH15 family glucan-1,4-alpha-glucosidase
MHFGIEDYALIGDCETAALVSRTGSIDWLCLPRFDSEACFASLLGSPENGHWQIAPVAKARVTRRYRPGTLILETRFRTRTGSVTLIDFMPLRKSHPQLIRILRCDSGKVRIKTELVIRFDYGRTIPWVTRDSDGGLTAIAGPHLLFHSSGVPTEGERLRTLSEFVIRKGQTVTFDLQYSNSVQRHRLRTGHRTALRRTQATWCKWSCRCTYKGPFAEALERSLITLKALTYAPTGGVLAAATTSLPEQPGGERNWDYRYCWIRDATFTLLALIHAGYHHEARRWRAWLARSAAGSPDQLQVLYGVAGERNLLEWQVPWLSGYRGASPVRVGNAASAQLQLDIYGELADALYQDGHSSPTVLRKNLDFEFGLLQELTKIWRQPDQGIWEVRGPARHFTHSKVMIWVAFDRILKRFERSDLNAPFAEWRALRDKIHDDVCRRGFDKKLNSFVQYYGSRQADASLLLIPLVGFLPPSDPRIAGTVRFVEKQLLRGGLVRRYQTAHTDDGLRGSEGAFLPCSFWLADNYELLGRHAEAERLLQRLLKLRNDVGLLSEEYHLQHKCLVGNFPQAFSHVGLVNTIMNLYRPRGGPAHQRSS